MTSSVIVGDKSPSSNHAIGTAVLDISIVLATLLIAKQMLLGIDAMWTYAGPISLILALAAATWRLRQSGNSWADLGLSCSQSWRKTLVWTLAAMALTIVAGLFIEAFINVAVIDGATQAAPNNGGRFSDVPGNPVAFIYWLAVAWVIGGFAEEMLFRAFLISRFETLFSYIPYGLILAVILPAILFGQQHYYYQGISGAFATGGVALISGILYLVFKRNLWPLTLSHGLANSIGLTLIYTGIQSAG